MFSLKNNPFQKIEIPKDIDVVVVSDYFAEELTGGAELTTQALIEASPVKIFKIKSNLISLDTLKSGFNKFWIFGNYSGIDWNLIPTIVTNLNYSVIEYDYKFCKFRSPEKHKLELNEECNCSNETIGKLVSTFYAGAKALFWMSEKQKNVYIKKFPFLSNVDNFVISSIFNKETLSYIKHISNNQKNDKYVILDSNSWIKGTKDCIDYCNSNNIKYELIKNLEYTELLDKLSKSKGLIFLPKGNDTCPRLVIEAKLLNCDLVLNDHVQHKNEDWFNTTNIDSIYDYLLASPTIFWNCILNIMNKKSTLSGYTTVKNCISQDYPWKESIASLLGFCDEVVVVDGGSSDGTWEQLQELAYYNNKLKIFQNSYSESDQKNWAKFDGSQKAFARSKCTKEYCWQNDIDEVVHENHYEKIRGLLNLLNGSNGVQLVALPVLEFWGMKGKVRCDVTPWKWRLSKNDKNITHGIPKNHKKFDENGNEYSIGSDGCDYIYKNSQESVPFVTFFNEQIAKIHQGVLQHDENSFKAYNEWFQKVIEELPCVYHYSWFKLERKIHTYKNYWSKHWQNLYNVSTEDLPGNNMFFNKSWKDVTDQEIKELAIKLENDMCGWIFHSKINWSVKHPSLNLKYTHPSVMNDWIKI